MLFFYIRHGEPIYSPDSLTVHGKRQAEAVAKRLSLYGIDKVFSSTSTRAVETAIPTCEYTKQELTQLDFCHESHAGSEFMITLNGQWRWAFDHPEIRKLFADEEIINMGHKWYDHPAFSQYPGMKSGIERISKASDEFFMSLGYEHVGKNGVYKAVNHSDDRVALFAHQGFGLAFLSCILDIPYPWFSTHFDFCHTGMTVIEFKPDENNIVMPKILTLSSDSHLYREGIPTFYNRELYF